jgi:hypothetical protein
LLARVSTALDAGGTRENCAAGVLYIFCQVVVLAETALERDELLVGVALKRDEEQAGIELARLGVHAVGEGVAAAQYSLVRVFAGEADVGVSRDQG